MLILIYTGSRRKRIIQNLNGIPISDISTTWASIHLQACACGQTAIAHRLSVKVCKELAGCLRMWWPGTDK